MFVTIRDLTALAAALATAKKLYAGVNAPALVGKVALVADDAGLFIAATNLDVFMLVEIEHAEIENPGRVVVQFAELEQVLKKAKSATSIKVAGVGDFVKFAMGKIDFEVRDLADSFPLVEPPTLYTWSNMPADFAAYLSRAVEFRSLDLGRMNLDSVFIGRGSKATNMVSTDGHRLYCAPLSIDLDKSVLLAGRMAEIFAGVATRKDNVRKTVELGYSPDGEKFALRVANYTLWGTPPHGSFPDLEQVFTNVEPHLGDIEIDLAEMREAIETAAIFAPVKTKFVGFAPVEGGLEISATNAELKSGKVKVDATHELCEGVVGFNFKYTLEALDVFAKGSKVKLRVHREGGKERKLSPAFFASDATPEFVVVMPLRD